MLSRISHFSRAIRGELLDATTRIYDEPSQCALALRRALEAAIWQASGKFLPSAEVAPTSEREVLASDWFREAVGSTTIAELRHRRARLNTIVHERDTDVVMQDELQAVVRVAEDLCGIRYTPVTAPPERVRVENSGRGWFHDLIDELLDLGRVVISDRGANRRIVVVALAQTRLGLGDGAGTGQLAARLAEDLGGRFVAAVGCSLADDQLDDLLRGADLVLDVRAGTMDERLEFGIRGPRAQALAQQTRQAIGELANTAARADNLDTRTWDDLETADFDALDELGVSARSHYVLRAPSRAIHGVRQRDILPRIGQRSAHALARALHVVHPSVFDEALAEPRSSAGQSTISTTPVRLRQQLDALAFLPDGVYGELERGLAVFASPNLSPVFQESSLSA